MRFGGAQEAKEILQSRLQAILLRAMDGRLADDDSGACCSSALQRSPPSPCPLQISCGAARAGAGGAGQGVGGLWDRNDEEGDNIYAEPLVEAQLALRQWQRLHEESGGHCHSGGEVLRLQAEATLQRLAAPEQLDLPVPSPPKMQFAGSQVQRLVDRVTHSSSWNLNLAPH